MFVLVGAVLGQPMGRWPSGAGDMPGNRCGRTADCCPGSLTTGGASSANCGMTEGDDPRDDGKF